MYNHLNRFFFLLFLFFSLLTAPVVLAAGSVVDQQIDKLIPVFESGNPAQVKKAAGSLAWTGISSPRLFDVVQTRLLNSYELTSKANIELSGWLIKALSYSGNDKYRGTLEKMLDEAAAKKVRGYAKKALPDLDRFKSWNPEINQGLTGLNQEQTEQQRVKNMLASSNVELLRVGAKRIVHAYSFDNALLKLAESRLIKEYSSNNTDKVFIDAMAWLCKALASSGDTQYKATLTTVEQGATSKKLRKYARKYGAQL